MLTYLWKTYLQAPDARFKHYIKTLKAEYEEERQDYSAEQLMLLAENEYKNLNQAGEWGNLSDAEAEIVALNAKIEVLKQKGTKKPEGKAKKEDKQDDYKKEKKKNEKKKTDFCWQKPRTNPTKILLVPLSPKQNNQRVGSMGTPPTGRFHEQTQETIK